MQTTSTTYRMIARDLDRSLAVKAAERPVALEVAYYRETIGKVGSIEDFLKDTRLVRFAMTAFGLEEMAHAKGFIRKVLSEGVADSKSFANRLADDRFVAFARAFDFTAHGEATTSRAAVGQAVIDGYIRQKLETAAGEDNEGVRLALYFQRQAPNVKSAYGLLADTALWKVVQTVFGFPDEMAAADISKQAAAVTRRLDVATLSDPDQLSRFITRFLASWDARNIDATSPVLSLFTPSGSGVGLDLIMTLNNLKHGGS